MLLRPALVIVKGVSDVLAGFGGAVVMVKIGVVSDPVFPEALSIT